MFRDSTGPAQFASRKRNDQARKDRDHAVSQIPYAPRRIDSPANPEWKDLRKALRQGSLVDGRYWIVETTRLLDEAVRSGVAVGRIYGLPGQLAELRQKFPALHVTDWVEVGERALEAVAGLESHQGILALVERPQPQLPDFLATQQWLVVLDRIQDPGNAGAIVRCAEAFGVTGMVFLKGSASPDAPKVLRASAGSLFRVPFISGVSAEEFLAASKRFRLYAASPEASASIGDLRFQFPAAVVFGNEGAGVSAELDKVSTGFRIPVQRVESLNAAVSAGIVLYQMAAMHQGARP